MTIKAMVLMVCFAVVWAMFIAFIGTGRKVGTAGNPALLANIAESSVSVADSKTAGAMVLPTADRTTGNRGLSAQIIWIAGYINLAYGVCSPCVKLTLIGVCVICGIGATAD